MQADGRVGPAPVSDGSIVPFRLSRDSATIVQHGHARHQEAVLRGNVYMAANVGSVAMSLGAAAATGFIITNPLGSGKNLVILSIQSQISAAVTAVAGVGVFANINPAAAAVVHTTPLIVRNALLGGPAGVALVDSAATLPAAPVLVRPLYGWHWVAAGTPTTQIGARDDVEGQLILAPGTAISIQSLIVAHSAISGAVWEEVPQ